MCNFNHICNIVILILMFNCYVFFLSKNSCCVNFFLSIKREETKYLMEIKDQIEFTDLIGKVGEKQNQGMSKIYEEF